MGDSMEKLDNRIGEVPKTILVCPFRLAANPNCDTSYILNYVDIFECLRDKCAIWDTYYSQCILARTIA